ncbi:hypothetical protein V8C34DRAFT_310351 [Trichoderma compactum]
MTPADKLAFAQSSNPLHAGIKGTEEVLKWIWNIRYSAVASYAIFFEVYPPKQAYRRNGDQGDAPGVFLHEYLIAGWGIPIGEVFDLEELSQWGK